MEKTSRDRWSLAISLAVAILVPALVFLAVPVWIAMLSGLESIWPTQMRLLFSGYKLTLIYPLAVLGLWRLSSKSDRRWAVVPVLAVLGACVILAATWWAGTDPDTVLEAIRRT